MFNADMNYTGCYYYSRPLLNSLKAYEEPQVKIIYEQFLYHAFAWYQPCYINAGM